MVANTPPGPGVDASGQTVVDPTANVIAIVQAESRLTDEKIASVRREAELRGTHATELRVAESARIDAIRAVDVGAVAAANQSAETRASTLATQVATQAEAVRVGLAAALEPIQRDIADLRRVQYEAAGNRVAALDSRDDRRSDSSRVAVFVSIAIAATSTVAAIALGVIAAVR